MGSSAVLDQDGRVAEFVELSQQNGDPTEVGEGAVVDGAARDGKDIWHPGQGRT